VFFGPGVTWGGDRGRCRAGQLTAWGGGAGSTLNRRGMMGFRLVCGGWPPVGRARGSRMDGAGRQCCIHAAYSCIQLHTCARSQSEPPPHQRPPAALQDALQLCHPALQARKSTPSHLRRDGGRLLRAEGGEEAGGGQVGQHRVPLRSNVRLQGTGVWGRRAVWGGQLIWKERQAASLRGT